MRGGPKPRGTPSARPPDPGREGPVLAAALPFAAVSCALLWIQDLARHPLLALLLLGLGFAALAVAAGRLEARTRPLGNAVLAGALLMRLPLLPLPPTLSDDALRYLWDGKVAAAGQNPYTLAPEAPALSPLRDEAWRKLPHRQVPTVYPPLALAAFSIASRFPFPLLAWKALATAADLAACALLLALARRSGVPEGRAVWYAWNPVVALEVAGMGHVDVLGVAAVLAAVLLLPRPAGSAARSAGSTVWAAGAAAAGVLAKLVPLAALPMWARQSGRPLRFLAFSGVLLAAAGLPVLAATGGLPRGLLAYGVSWEFDGPVFEPLWRLLDRAGAAPAAKAGLDQLKDWTGRHELWNRFYPFVYPQLLAKLLLAAGAVAAIAASLAERDPVAGTGRLFGRLLLLSATVYPWYLLWVLPWAALHRHRAWIALSALLPLSYLPQTAGVPLFPWVYLAIWGPFALLCLLGPRWPPAPASPPSLSPAPTP